MLALEEMREVAAALYLNEFGSSWKPVSSSRFNHSAMMTSALVEGRDFLRARAEAKRRAAVPEGTPVVFAGGRTRHATEDDALAFGNNVWATLDKVRDRVPTWCSSMAATRRASTAGIELGGTPQYPAGHVLARHGWALVLASSATSGCSPSIRAMSSPFQAMACSNVWSSKPRPGGSPWSIGAGPWDQSGRALRQPLTEVMPVLAPAPGRRWRRPSKERRAPVSLSQRRSLAPFYGGSS